ncbi:MAG: hypothetical protein HY782_01200 [Chloroflexi bacterium]|nr:hypothetical protein [Chloroflexota bacterium]
MDAVAKLVLSCGLVLLWVFVNLVGAMYALRKRPTRMSFASVAGIATGFVIALGMAVGLAPNLANNQPESWLVVVAVGLLAFVIVLLWTYVAPVVSGNTWEALVKSARSKINPAKAHHRSAG